MSYILDALRRADSERERERSAVPGLHAQAVPAGAPDADGDAPASRWKWPIVAAFVALLGLVAWLWVDRADVPQAVPALAPPFPPEPAPSLPMAAPVAPAPATATATATATSTAATVPALLPTAPAAAAPALPREAAPVAVRKPAAAPTTSAAAPRKGSDASSAAARAALAAKASEPEPKVSTLAELPDDVRRELPAITVGGSIYSKSAANRMLVINGQVFHEGDALATGLVLEQIRQKSAVLRFRTYHYEITY